MDESRQQSDTSSEHRDLPFRLALEKSAIGMALVSPDGLFLSVNPALCGMLGRDAAELTAATWQELTHPDDLRADEDLVADVLMGSRDDYRLRKRYLRSDGSVVWGDLSVACVRDEAGAVVHFISQIVDITDHVLDRERLAESEARYRLLAENASDVVTLINVDGTVEWVSPSVQRTLGMDPTGTSVWDLVHPDDHEMVGIVLTADDETIHAMPDLELRILHADGDYRWMQAAGRHATATQLVVSLRLIEDQVQARARLSASEEHYRLLAENSSDVVLLTGPDGLLSWVSPSAREVLGWEQDSLIGRRLDELVHPDDQPSIDGSPARYRRKDGTYRWMSLKTTTFRDDDGETTSAVTGMRDVDDLVKARERAEAEEARLAATLDSLLDPHVLLSAVRAEDGRIIDFTFADANDAACDYLGVERAHLEGNRLLAVIPGQAGSGMLEMYARAVESGEPLALDDYPYRPAPSARERRFDIRAVRVGDALSFTWRDVTERHDAVARVSSSERHYRLLADNSSDVVMHSRDGIVLWVSPSLTRTLGWTPDEVIGTDSTVMVHPEDLARLSESTAPPGGTVMARYRLRAKSGDYHWCDVHAAEFIDEDGMPNGVVASFRIVDDEVAAERELERRAMYDELTGTLKRDGALARLGTLTQDDRRSGSVTAVLFCDVDNLKQVNDEQGHAVGDELLRAVAERLRESVRSTDTIARVGGDEFLVILNGVHGLDGAKSLAEVIRARVAEPIARGSDLLQTSVSVGLTMVHLGEDPEDTVARADRAMYAAKRAGRNTVRALNPG